MKVRAQASAALAVTGGLLVAVTVSACTGGAPSASTPHPTVQAQSNPATGGAPGTARPSAGVTTAHVPPSPGKTSSSGQGGTTAGPSASASSTPGRRPSATVPAGAPVPSATQYPSGAPETGGGGTAGLADGVLFGFGGAGILAGLASFAYRRRLIRTRPPR